MVQLVQESHVDSSRTIRLAWLIQESQNGYNKTIGLVRLVQDNNPDQVKTSGSLVEDIRAKLMPMESSSKLGWSMRATMTYEDIWLNRLVQ